jgi:hypothetical protein
MKMKLTMKPKSKPRKTGMIPAKLSSIWAAAALAAVTLAPAAFAQDAPPRIEFGPLTIHGHVLSEGRFDAPFRTTQPDGTVILHRAGFEIAILGEGFPIRALDPILWVDDVPIRNYERRVVDGREALVFLCVEPKLLRAERSLQVIYGNDERTRTRLIERLDPETLIRLPQAQRAELGIPELEGVTIETALADGAIAGRGRVSGGELRLAARLKNGRLEPLRAAVALDGHGRFAAQAGALPEGTTHVALLLVTGDGELRGASLHELPDGVELLDSKPVGTKPAGR